MNNMDIDAIPYRIFNAFVTAPTNIGPIHELPRSTIAARAKNSDSDPSGIISANKTFPKD